MFHLQKIKSKQANGVIHSGNPSTKDGEIDISQGLIGQLVYLNWHILAQEKTMSQTVRWITSKA